MKVISDPVRAEIENVMNDVKVPEPVVTLSRGPHPWSPISIGLKNSVTCTSGSLFRDDIFRHIRAELDIANRQVKMTWNARMDMMEAIMHRAYETITVFINNMYHTKNNKLTGLFRWYDIKIRYATTDMELQADIFHIAKYILSKGKSLKYGDDTVAGIIQALELIKTKHEARGITVR